MKGQTKLQEGKKQNREEIQGEKIAEWTKRSSERWTMNIYFPQGLGIYSWLAEVIGTPVVRLNLWSFPTDTEIKGRVP